MRFASIVPLVRRLVATSFVFVMSICGGTGATCAYAQSVDTSSWPIKTIVIKSPRNADVTNVQAVSADGSVIVGFNAKFLSGTSTAIRWTPQTGVQDLDIPDAKVSRAFSVSADGKAVSGTVDGKDGKSQGFRWTEKEGLQKFGSDWSHVETTGMSDNGAIVVGTFWHYYPQAFYWTEQEGVQSLAEDKFFQAMKLTRTVALGVSGDGSTIVGWAADDRRNHAMAFRWTKARGVQFIGDVGGGDKSPPWMGVSRDGSVIVGSAFDDSYSASSKAFRWTEREGLKELVPESDYSYALGMSSDGSRVFGMYGAEGRSGYFIWTKDRGMRDAGVEDLAQYLITDEAIFRIAFHD